MSGKLIAANSVQNAAIILRSLGNALPRVFKFLFLALFLINVRSWPIVWHYRVFKRAISLRLQWLFLRLTLLFKSPRVKKAIKQKWQESLSPVGQNPFEHTVSHKTWAGPDDCDFNLHLSNSSYAKSLDSARFEAALAFFPTFFRSGGRMALGATHYSFLREIPMLAQYEIRISIATWEQKWIYVIVRYVTPAKRRKAAPRDITSIPHGDSAPFPSLKTPATGTNTPAGSYGGSATDLTSVALKQVPAAQLQSKEPDGATLHCLSISELCFKIGRITVPPAVVLAVDGFSVPPPSGEKPYSHANPPPHWPRVRALRDIEAEKGSLKTLHEFFKGGWRDMPEGERWWEDALGGVIEERRKANLERVIGVRQGMENAREAY